MLSLVSRCGCAFFAPHAVSSRSTRSGFLLTTLSLIHSSVSFILCRECVIVVDGANVACQKDGHVHVPKLAAAIQYFRSLQRTVGGHPIKCVAFAPNFWLHAKPSSSSSDGCRNSSSAIGAQDSALLKEMVQSDAVILTPSHAHDDLYVIDYAVKYDGFIVTNDMFRDHVSNKVRGR